MRLNEWDNKAEELVENFDKALTTKGVDNLFSVPEPIKALAGITPADMDELNYECDFYCQHQEWAKAIDCLSYMILVEPLRFIHYLRLGVVIMHMQKLEQAIAVLQMSCIINPTDPRPHLYLGNCLLQLNKQEEAKAEFDDCVELAKFSNIDDRQEVENLALEAVSVLR